MLPVHPNVEPTFQWTLGDRFCRVYDDLFDDAFVTQFSEIVIAQSNFQPRESFDNELNAGFPRDFVKRLPQIYPTVLTLLPEPRENYRLSHAYAALITSDNRTMIHQDGTDHGCFTFLYYLNRQWRDEWAGETHFYDEQKRRFASVLPKAGRLVAFHGSLWHKAGVPAACCPENRYGLSLFFHHV